MEFCHLPSFISSSVSSSSSFLIQLFHQEPQQPATDGLSLLFVILARITHIFFLRLHSPSCFHLAQSHPNPARIYKRQPSLLLPTALLAYTSCIVSTSSSSSFYPSSLTSTLSRPPWVKSVSTCPCIVRTCLRCFRTYTFSQQLPTPAYNR